MSKTVELFLVQAAHVKAMHEAQHASHKFAHEYMGGRDGGPCGFAWVNSTRSGRTRAWARPCRAWGSARTTVADCNNGTNGGPDNPWMPLSTVRWPTPGSCRKS